MVQYLKYIVLVFGGLGLLIGGFFFFQNKHDINVAWDFEDRFEIKSLKQSCPELILPCLERQFSDYAKKVSLTGMSMGMKMVFNTMEEAKAESQQFVSDEVKDFTFSLSFLRLNNIAMSEVYKNYYGFQVFYPGYIGSLPRFYDRAYQFSQNIINGLAGPTGLEKIAETKEGQVLLQEFTQVQNQFYAIKAQVNEFIEMERKRLQKNE